MNESSLYPAVKRFLEAQGYEVKGEIAGCDVVGIKVGANDVVGIKAGANDVVGIKAGANDVFGIKPGEPSRLVIAEMKLGLNLELILQAVDRMAGADEIWLAVPATRRGRDRDSRARKLCRLLGFGLLAIHPRHHVEVLAEPTPYQPRRDPRARRRITKEHAARRGDPSPGGTGGRPVMTAYRQEALHCATRLQHGPLRPRDLRPDAPRAATILHRNVYGWFERVSRGLYALTPSGLEAIPPPEHIGDPLPDRQ